MSSSHIPSSNNRQSPKTQISCTRCNEIFHIYNQSSMTCPDCHQCDIDYTIRLGNQVRIFQIDVALNQKDILERLAVQLEQEKQELLKNI